MKNLLASLLRKAAEKISSEKPTEREFVVVVTGAGDPVTEKISSESPLKAAELAAAVVAKRRMQSTMERSWKIQALVEDQRFHVQTMAVIRSEVLQ